MAGVTQFAPGFNRLCFRIGGVWVVADQALPHIDRDVYCALAVLLSFSLMAGQAQIRIILCQQGVLIRGMRVMTPYTIPFAYRRMDVFLFEVRRIILMAFEAQRFAAFHQ